MRRRLAERTRLLGSVGVLVAIAGCTVNTGADTDLRTVTSSNDSCSTRAGAYATCPAGYHLTGGGHHLASWDQRASGGGIEPVIDEAEDNGWHVKGAGAVGTACFTAYATCAR